MMDDTRSAAPQPSVNEQLAAAGLLQTRREEPPEAEFPDAGAERLPGEVVECYDHWQGREVVEYFTQPRPPIRGRSAPPPKKHRRKGLWIFLACAAVLVGLTAAALLLQDRGAPPADSSQEPPLPAESSQQVSIPVYEAEEGVALAVSKAHGPSLSPQEIYRRVNPSVVTVLTEMKGGTAVGTGVIFTADGYILTNYHVVSGGVSCQVTLPDNVNYPALYVAGDAGNDLAILKVDAGALTAAEIGASDALTVGDRVYAIGNPLGTELRGTFTDGIVSAIDRDVDVDGRTMTLVQTNAALNSGNSGGPLINEFGQVVGINTIKMSSAFDSIEGLGFAIPSSFMQSIVNDLLAYGQVLPEPKLGLMVEQTATRLPDGTLGARIASVDPGFAGERAGLLAGDVIVSAGGEQVAGSRDVLRARRNYHVGGRMPMTVWRDGDYLEVTLELLEGVG